MIGHTNESTPKLSSHARDRCKEMGLSTKKVKRAFATGNVDYPGPPEHGINNRIRLSGDVTIPIAVAYDPNTKPPEIITVLWRTEFEREGVK